VSASVSDGYMHETVNSLRLLPRTGYAIRVLLIDESQSCQTILYCTAYLD
jgi:hypothetical protein